MNITTFWNKNRQWIIEFVKYGITAGIATLCDWGSYYIFYDKLKINYLIAACFSFVIWFTVNYILSVIFVFKESKYKRSKEFFLVLVTSLIGLGINMICLYILVDLFFFIPIIAKMIATAVCMIWNFIMRKLFVFK